MFALGGTVTAVPVAFAILVCLGYRGAFSGVVSVSGHCDGGFPASGLLARLLSDKKESDNENLADHWSGRDPRISTVRTNHRRAVPMTRA